MMRPLYPSLALFAALLGPLLHGADSTAKPPPLKVTVSDVLEIRGTAPKASECRLTLNLLGDAAADAHSVFHIRVLKTA